MTCSYFDYEFNYVVALCLQNIAYTSGCCAILLLLKMAVYWLTTLFLKLIGDAFVTPHNLSYAFSGCERSLTNTQNGRSIPLWVPY